jgi:hypothetical protein
MSKSSVTICTYHRTIDNPKVIKDFICQNFDYFYVLFDNSLNKNTVELEEIYGNTVITYDKTDFEKEQFNRPINPQHRWGNHQNPNYFYAHFRMLLFYLQKPKFDYYWFFDDDVTFQGNIKPLIHSYDSVDDDFIAIQAFKKKDYPEFPRISVINNRMSGSRGHWLDHAPGPGDNFLNTDKHIGSFFPIVRFSNRAMKYLYDINSLGFYGYSEGFVPTSLASNGYKLSSILDEHNNFFLKNDLEDCKLYHKGMDFTWEWL